MGKNQSHRRLAPQHILKTYDASPIISASTQEPMGITVGGWEITTSSSPIGNESQMDYLGDSLQSLILDDRRILLPEIVYFHAFVSVKYTGGAGAKEGPAPPSTLENDADEEAGVNVDGRKEVSPMEIKFTAQDSLEEWAKCHAHLATSLSYMGVSVMKTVDAKLWEARQARERQQASSVSTTTSAVRSSSNSSSSTTRGDLFGKGAAAAALQNCSTEFNYDWSYSTPYAGSIGEGFRHGGPCPTSGIETNMHLLTDQTQPILYFDDVRLYEDDMHDNGYVSLRAKIRVMPKCFFVLLSLFVRIDHVLIRIKESRFLCKFDDDEADEIKIYRDITWKECSWENLTKMNLPAHIGSWRIEEEEPTHQRRIHGLQRAVPKVQLPDALSASSCFVCHKI
jgi:type 2A phosphatase activator TIP41